MFSKDNIYNDVVDDVIDFTFDEKIAKVFPDMAHRSIAGYASLLTLLQAIFRHEFKNNNDLLVYDLGCSVGGVIAALANVMPIQTRFVGVDLSQNMLEQASKAIKRLGIPNSINWVCADVTQLKLDPCNAICINYTLQFIAKDSRQKVLDDCFLALKSGGLLVVAEKVQSSDNVIKWHEQFKRNNGYSELEIAQKRTSIENVMKIDSSEVIENRLRLAGFTNIYCIFQSLSFKSWVAIK